MKNETMKKETLQALDFLQSMRGRYILSQSLYYGIKELEKVKSPHTEISNIKDMKFLRDNLFYFFIDVDDIDMIKEKLKEIKK